MNLRASPADQTVRQILRHPLTLGTTLVAIGYHTFGDELYGWEPETLELEFKDEWDVEVPEANLERLHALVSASVSNTFYHDWVAFSVVNQILCGGESSPLDGADPLLVAEAAWGVTEVKLNDSARHEFGDDVSRFVGTLLWEEGFTTPPPALKFAKLPEVYQGSTPAVERAQATHQTTEHARVVHEYVTEQATMLFKQLSLLPWMGEAELARMANEIRSN